MDEQTRLNGLTTMKAFDDYVAAHPTTDPASLARRKERHKALQGAIEEAEARHAANRDKQNRIQDDINNRNNSNSKSNSNSKLSNNGKRGLSALGDDDDINQVTGLSGDGNDDNNGGLHQSFGIDFDESPDGIIKAATIKYTKNEINTKEYERLISIARDMKVADGGLQAPKKKRRRRNQSSSIVRILFIFHFSFYFFFF